MWKCPLGNLEVAVVISDVETGREAHPAQPAVGRSGLGRSGGHAFVASQRGPGSLFCVE